MIGDEIVSRDGFDESDDATAKPSVLVRCPYCRREQRAPSMSRFRCAGCGKAIDPPAGPGRPPLVDWRKQPMLVLQVRAESPTRGPRARRLRQFPD